MQELEEDADLRSRINLYKDPDALAAGAGGAGAGGSGAQPAGMEGAEDEDSDEDGEGLPTVPLDELLDDLEALGLEEEGEGEEEEEEVDDDNMSED
jgi:nonsense-mediated mRNA decay protein 3